VAGQKGVALAKARTSEENRRDSRNMGRSTWYIGIYVYMHVCIYVCMCAYMYVYI